MMGGEVSDYEIRLKRVGLTTLETRRLRADMLEVYKIMNGVEGIIEAKIFKREKGEGTDLNSAKKGAAGYCQICFCKQGVCHVE